MEPENLKKAALADVKNAGGARELEEVRVKYLGRNGLLTGLLRSLKNLTLEERRKAGPKLQSLKKELEELIEKELSKRGPRTHGRKIDLTAPGRRMSKGHLHPLTLVDQEIRKIFLSMNFSVVEGPEAESEYYNFDVLNFPPNHPAREMQDTFWIRSESENPRSNLLLRTQTSPMQVRYMEEYQPPLQIIVPGRTFRNEAIDAGHEINFHQVEGLMVGKSISLANFKFVVEEFFRKFFAGQEVDFRYRPSYFPFVEPGLEVVVRYQGKWFEVMGAGMVHPRVFEYAHYNPNDWQGFAFGVGRERLAMIKYKIPDIRLFYSGDLRFIKQF